MNATARITAALAAGLTLAACGGQPASTGSHPAATQQAVPMPHHLTGHGTDGSVSTLTITTGQGGRFTGTYITSLPGMAPGTGLSYAVAGQQMPGQRFTSTWTAASIAVRVTGRWTQTTIILDNPRHNMATTRFDVSPLGG